MPRTHAAGPAAAVGALHVAPAEEQQATTGLQRRQRVAGALEKRGCLAPKVEAAPFGVGLTLRGVGIGSLRECQRMAVAAVVVAPARTLNLLLGWVGAVAVLLEGIPHGAPLLVGAALSAGAVAAEHDEPLVHEEREVIERRGYLWLGVAVLDEVHDK